MEAKRVLITRDIPEDGIKILHDHGFLIEINKENRPLTAEELNLKAKQADFLICTLADKIDQTFIGQNLHLKLITNFAVGVNNIDVDYALKNNIWIGNTPDILTDATAEIALGLMLVSMRRFKSAHQAILDETFQGFAPKGYLGRTPHHKTLGIIGMGRIGLKMAEMCRDAFKMKVIYTTQNTLYDGFDRVELDELLKQSDVISLHCPLTDKTRNLLSGNKFNLLKSDVTIINTARGEVINQDDLMVFLKNNPQSFAGLDVTSPEPLPKNHPLIKVENVYILPHIGSATVETRGEMSKLCAENILAYGTNKEMNSIMKPHP